MVDSDFLGHQVMLETVHNKHFVLQVQTKNLVLITVLHIFKLYFSMFNHIQTNKQTYELEIFNPESF